ncbi:MAG: efflux RND transporter periplasmic adaptor subunit [Burkholderiaceae bacterium]|nr:efflux RND transporter periplasmic adaptor subunit [Burkholderiaceae bacterium]
MMPTRDAALLAVLVTLAACQKEPAARSEPPRPVRVQVVQASKVELGLSLPGEVRPRVETRYGFRIGGKVAQRLVSLGDRVAPGTVIARLDPQDVGPAIDAQSAQLEAARTEYRLAQLELERLRALRARGFVSTAQVDRQQASADALKARVDAALAQLDAARNNAAFQVLRADAPGVVTAVEAEAGQVVAAAQTVIRVAGSAHKDILVHVPEGDFAAAKAAAVWTVSIPALGAKNFAAKLHEISPLSDPASRTYAARLALQGDTAGVELGMSAVAVAPRERASAFVLPLSVLWSRDGQTYVWVVDTAKMTVSPVAVRTGGLLDDAVRVLEGLNAGDTVVTAGANLLEKGQAVRLLESGK